MDEFCHKFFITQNDKLDGAYPPPEVKKHWSLASVVVCAFLFGLEMTRLFTLLILQPCARSCNPTFSMLLRVEFNGNDLEAEQISSLILFVYTLLAWQAFPFFDHGSFPGSHPSICRWTIQFMQWKAIRYNFTLVPAR